MKTVFINGKFTAQRTTGVQRVAACVVEALDGLAPSLAMAKDMRFVLLCPPGPATPVLQNIEVRHIGSTGGRLHFWEQIVLPMASRGALLLNLAGSAPLMKRRQLCTFHDAAVFDCPQAHARAFAAWYRFLFRRLARRARSLLTISNFSKSRLVARLGIAPERVTVIGGSGQHMGRIRGRVGALERLGLTAGGYFVAVGSANPVKNFSSLLRAFAALPERCDARLVIVGDQNPRVFAPDGQAIDVPRVVHAGALADEELKALYEAALGLVFPSTYEGFGLPPLEAMNCGCPVAASHAASIPEACGHAALYFDPFDLGGISAAMMRLFDEPGLREELRTQGAARAANLSWEMAARQVVLGLVAADA
ncbi:glycosyltransferase family 4 protein [Sphaerotilaceae bacterium SBD11-9]